MRPGVIGCLRDATVPMIASIMIANGIHAVVVSPPAVGAPLLISDLDLVRAALELPEDARAADLAREPMALLSADAPLAEAVEQMAIRYVTHVLAVHPTSGALVGIVSSLDVAAVAGGREPRLARLDRPGPARPAPSAHTLPQASVRDVMHPGVVTCPPNVSISTVARMMADHRVHCIAVAGVDSTSSVGQHLTWGLIADIDVVRAAHSRSLASSAASMAATTPLAVLEDESLDRVAKLMVEHGANHVVAVGGTGLASGMISTLDVVGILAARA